MRAYGLRQDGGCRLADREQESEHVGPGAPAAVARSMA